MCWQMRKTPATFPDCRGKSQGNCILFDPVEDHIQWCVPAVQRGSHCESPIPTTQASSTRRKANCPKHRDRSSPTLDSTEQGGPGPAGSGGGIVKVGA
ncbi:hypothetical protein I7I48_11458 [Histoplasma ohiense]|nr:hypothetical protein I7I48_11458 [Histoplasma ohiense (nom. inval.)]